MALLHTQSHSVCPAGGQKAICGWRAAIPVGCVCDVVLHLIVQAVSEVTALTVHLKDTKEKLVETEAAFAGSK